MMLRRPGIGAPLILVAHSRGALLQDFLQRALGSIQIGWIFERAGGGRRLLNNLLTNGIKDDFSRVV